MSALSQLRVKIFADSAERARMLELRTRSYIRGFTTNPTLMRRSGVTDYRAFARDILSVIADKPVCFEVLADGFPEMERQALEIASWSDNVYVKIPITTTRRTSSVASIQRLAARGVKVNVTAVMTLALLNIFQAETAGCHAITVTTDILAKLSLIGHDLADYSLETVKMFHDDAESAGFTL